MIKISEDKEPITRYKMLMSVRLSETEVSFLRELAHENNLHKKFI